jgi:hypothetical protein
MSNLSDAEGKTPLGAPNEDGPKKKNGIIGQAVEAIKANTVKSVVGGIFIGLGILAVSLRNSADEFVQVQIDKGVAHALEAKSSETKKALFDVLQQGILDKQNEFRDSVVKAVKDSLKESEEQKVGSLISGTIELKGQYPEHTIYFYLPKSNHGDLWLSVQPRNAVADQEDAIARIILDNTDAGSIANQTAEYPLDLNEKLSHAAKTRRDPPVIDLKTGLPPQQLLQPTTIRFGDLHTITFKAHDKAFGDGNSNIWIKYLILISPAIMKN